MDSGHFFRNVRRIILVLFYIACIGVVVLAVVGIPYALLSPFGAASEPRPPDPPGDFKSITGWELPLDAQVIRAENTFGGFKNDGDYVLIVRTTPERVQKWIESSEAGQWKPCPIPRDIVSGCWRLPDHDGKLYRATKVADSDADWHRGTLVIVNAETGMICVYLWKV